MCHIHKLLTQEQSIRCHLSEGFFAIYSLPVDPPPNIIVKHSGKYVPCHPLDVLAPNDCQGYKLREKDKVLYNEIPTQSNNCPRLSLTYTNVKVAFYSTAGQHN